MNGLIRWINWRTLVAALALVLVLLPNLPATLAPIASLDRYLFQLGVRLSVLPPAKLDIKLVQLDPYGVSRLQHDLAESTPTQQLLLGLSRGNAVNGVVGLVLDELPQVQANTAEQLIVQEFASNQAGQKLLSDKQAIVSFLQSDKVVVSSRSVPAQALGVKQSVQVEASMVRDQLAWLPLQLQPRPPQLNFYPQGELVTLPLLSELINTSSLRQDVPLVGQQGVEVYSGFILSLYQQFIGSRDARWVIGGALLLDSNRIPLSIDGYLASAFQASSPQIQALTLLQSGEGKALIKQLKQADIILMSDDPRQLRSMAASLMSLEHRAFYHTPAWHWVLFKVLALLVGLYLCVLVPHLRSSAAILATCLWLLSLGVVQLGWQITQWQWLPMGSLMLLLFVGHGIMGLWQAQHRRQWVLSDRADQASAALARQLFREARFEEAQDALRDCDTSNGVLALLYDIGAQQERKRQFDAAIKTYRALLVRRSRYKDVGERLQSLVAMQQPSQASALANSQTEIAKTLVLQNSKVNKPVLGRYEVERELGRGAMGVVYLGLDPKITRRVAIKTLSYDHFSPDQLAEVKARFFREAEAAGRLSHPNIVTIFDVGEEHDLAFIAMDFINGQPLSNFCQPGQLLDVENVYRYMGDVAEALDYAHQHDVVHRDVKPSNMLFNANADKVTVTDFGIAHITDESRTRTGDILGSPLYMSPEQLKGLAVTQATDIYSLGVSFYQLLSGQLPFNGDNLAGLTYNIIHKDFKSVRKCRRELPASATRIINKAMQKDPERRFESAEEMAQAIRKSLQKDFTGQTV